MTAQCSSARVGDVRELQLVRNLTRSQIVQYAGASGDYNPLHTDEPFVRDTVGLPGVFSHGMLTMSMTARVLTDWFGPENVIGYRARFAAQVWPGDTLTATATVESVDTGPEGDDHLAISVRTLNQRGETVLSGSASIRQPSSDHQR